METPSATTTRPTGILASLPINGGGDTYIVVIPGNQNLQFNVPGTGHQVFQLSLASGSTLTVNSGRDIEVIDEASIDGLVTTAGGSFVANSTASTFFGNSGRITVSDTGQVAIAATSYTTNQAGVVVLSSEGAGTVLDLSSLQSIDAGWNDNWGGVNVSTIQATSGGTIDLSSVTSINAPARGEDRLDLVIAAGSQIDLSSLISLTSQSSGDTRFDIDTASYSLPALQNASNAQFDVAEGTTLDMAALVSHDRGSYTIAGSAVVNANSLTSLTNVTMTISQNGTFNATSLTDFSGSTVTITPDRTFNTAALTNIDNARFTIQGGATYGTSQGDVAATSYTTNQAGVVVLSSEGAGTVLDLSSLQSIDAGWNDNWGGVNVSTIQATSGGTIDLSGVTSINAPARGEDRLDLVAEAGSLIDLSSLVSVTNASSGQTRFVIGGGSVIKLGSLVESDNARFELNDISSVLDVAGSFVLDSGSISAAQGATVQVKGNFSFGYTNESNFAMDSGILHLDGTGGQRFEVGGEDLGLPGPTSENFGIGQLIIGQTTQRTSADLLDVVDNGNRGGGGEAEALYLFGLGGPDGLRILNDSALILNGINVYAWDAALVQMVYLNGLFQPGDLRIDFDDGFLQLVPLDFQWDNPLGGDFNLPTNWSDDLLPLASDSALWNLASIGGYTVQFGTNVATDSALVLNDGVTFDLGGFTYSTAGLHATESVVVGLSETDNGRLTVTNGTLTGSDARIAAAGGAIGLLTIAGTGSLELSGNLTLGDGDATLRVETGGTARVGQTLIIRETGVVDLPGGTVTVGSGPIETTASTLRIHADGTLLAGGEVQGNVVSAGQVQIGASPGTLHITGDFAQEASGSLEIEIDGALPGDEFDLLTVVGAATLDGRLDLLLDEAFIPTLAQEIAFLTADAGVSGTFATIDGVQALADLSLAVLYESNRVLIRATIPGDFDADNDVDGDDFLIWQGNFGATAGATWSTGDANGDGAVDGDDFLVWQGNFGSTSGSAATAAVPEPASLWVAIILAASLTIARPSKRHFRTLRW